MVTQQLTTKVCNDSVVEVNHDRDMMGKRHLNSQLRDAIRSSKPPESVCSKHLFIVELGIGDDASAET